MFFFRSVLYPFVHSVDWIEKLGKLELEGFAPNLFSTQIT